jgi:hypothetical protein
MTLTAGQTGCCEQLARFFPEVEVRRIPICVKALGRGTSRLQECTFVQFATDEIVIFPSTLPLEFDDHVRIERQGFGNAGEAIVVALQYYEGNKAIAVKLLDGLSDWISKP